MAVIKNKGRRISFIKGYLHYSVPVFYQPVTCRIHRLLLCGGIRPHTNECSRYDIKQSDGVVPVMLELWRMWSTLSLPSLPGPLWPGVVASERVLSIGETELNCVLEQN